MTNQKTIGFIGQRIAEEYLKNEGCKILQKNFHIRGGEIDLIALQKNELVFVEVKTRTDFRIVENEILHSHQIRALKRTAMKYLRQKPHSLWRFDLITVTIEHARKAHIKHLMNIF
ncbi:YraN family protein [Candidatus Peregrinibacteria bacterium]|nr:YraN family protein [Candidatus Peregrinibacteria bacterium]